jgi:peptidoglycan/LPS O-acetylase OafA/YrhL
VVYANGYALPRIVSHAIPAVIAVTGALMLEPAARARPSRFGLLLGDASYSIYLAHPFAQRAWLLGVIRTVGLPAISPTLYVVTAFLAGIGGGVICYWLIERHLLVAGRRLIRRFQPTR